MMTPLQLCPGGTDGVDYLTDFQFVEAVTCTYANAVGSFALVALLVYTAVGARIYIRTGSMMIPLGILMMGGGAFLTQMDSVATSFAVVLLLVVPSATIAYVYFRHSL